jgi:hypothetical protein
VVVVVVLVVAGAALLRRRRRRAPLRIDPGSVGLSGAAGVGVVGFSSPYCLPCQEWEAGLRERGIDFAKVDVATRPDLARRYRVRATPLVLAVRLPEGDVVEAFHEAPRNGELARLAAIAGTGPDD